MRTALILILIAVLRAAPAGAQDDGSGGTGQPPPPVFTPGLPGGPATPIGGGALPPGGIPGALPPGGALPGGGLPGTVPPGAGFPPPTGTGTGTGTSTGALPGIPPAPGGPAVPPPVAGGPGTPITGGPPVSGGGTQVHRVTDQALLGPMRALQERGRSLFSSVTLGRSTVSCRACHRIEDLRPIARVYPRYNPFLREVATLEQAQNACLARFMRGSPLPFWSRNAIALSMFLVME